LDQNASGHRRGPGEVRGRPTPLLEIGDPLDLEVVADLLSTDAVGIKPGAPVLIDGWGGAPIKARVTRVDPVGFLKVSALGIDEQRVRVTIDFVDGPKSWSTLGHDYRVTVHVTVWNSDNAVTVPVGALFRKAESWAVFLVKEGRARIALVQIGHRNSRVASDLRPVGWRSAGSASEPPYQRWSEGRKAGEQLSAPPWRLPGSSSRIVNRVYRPGLYLQCFPSPNGGANSPGRQSTIYCLRLVAAQALGRVRPHMLRHACGYDLADKGTDFRLMQDFLGHRNPRHTAHYTRKSPARFNKIWD
jgi:hypothetical protein